MALNASEKKQRIVMHCDINAFYPACETHRDPSLVGKPLIVGEPGRKRRVVTSSSYEARKYGVKSGMPVSQAKKLCPNGIFVSPDWDLYGQTSEEVMTLLRAHADTLEQSSIDEAFLDVSGRCENYDDATALAVQMKQELKDEEGMTMSIGIAPNKSIAKIASDFRKPDGLTVVRPEEVDAFLDPLPVEKISGVGKKTTEFLNSKDIKTIGELRKVPAKDLRDWFGRGGVWLWAIANGIEETPVEERGQRKSISVEQTFERDVKDKALVVQAIEALSKEVHERLLEEGLLFRTVGIKVRFEGFQTFTREKSHTGHVSDGKLVDEYSKLLFREFENNPKRIRLVGVRLSGFHKSEGQQTKLA